MHGAPYARPLHKPAPITRTVPGEPVANHDSLYVGTIGVAITTHRAHVRYPVERLDVFFVTSAPPGLLPSAPRSSNRVAILSELWGATVRL
jgi:hypothetical protein